MEKRLGLHAGLLAIVGASTIVEPFVEPGGIEPPPLHQPVEPKNALANKEPGFLAPSLVAYREMVVEHSRPLPATYERATLETVIKAMERYRSRVFQERDFEDIRIYLSIYKAVAERYGLDWRLLWVIHDQETLCSFMRETDEVKVYVFGYDKNGKPIENHLYGAMQRSINYFPDTEAEAALAGLEHLKKIKTRVPTDAREIAWAGKRLSQLLREEKGNLLGALKRYSAQQPAKTRWELFNFYTANIPK